MNDWMILNAAKQMEIMNNQKIYFHCKFKTKFKQTLKIF